MKVSISAYYPCGHHMSMNYESSPLDVFGFGKADFDLQDGCPLHGLNCPYSEIKEKPRDNTQAVKEPAKIPVPSPQTKESSAVRYGSTI